MRGTPTRRRRRSLGYITLQVRCFLLNNVFFGLNILLSYYSFRLGEGEANA